MTNVSATLDRRCIPDRRHSHERRSEAGGISAAAEQTGQQTARVRLSIKSFSFILGAAMGIVIYKGTGLYDAADSVMTHAIVNGGLIYGYILAFVKGLYSS